MNAEVQTALRSLLAHLEPFDVDRNYYKGRVIARLKKELLPKKHNKVVEKTGWFRDWIDDAFDAYIINFQVIILSEKEIVFEYESENSIGDIGSSDNEDLISEQSELAPDRILILEPLGVQVIEIWLPTISWTQIDLNQRPLYQFQ